MKRDFASVGSALNSIPGSQAPPSVSRQVGPPTSQSAVLVGEVKHRTGMVLDPSTLIKVDDYLFKKQPSRPSWFPRRISGAEELRLVEGTSIVGVAQPSLPGVRGILDSLNAGRNVLASSFDSGPNVNKKKVLWINLREEPLLYLNGRPVVLRERGEPFRNIEIFRGISESRLRDLEWRFKEDVVAEAQRCGGSVLLHEEERENMLVEKWESAPPSAVMTAEDVFFQLRQEGYRVRYQRLPCTSGLPPARAFFDELLRCVMTTDRETWVVFNCQSGNARSTFAMIATYAIQTRQGFWRCPTLLSESSQQLDDEITPDRKKSSKKDVIEEPIIPITIIPATTPPLPLNGSLSNPLPGAVPSPGIPDEQKDETARQLLAGWYLPILQLIRLLVGGGREAKSRMDAFIDQCAHTCNLRTEVLKFRAKAANAREKFYRSLFVLRASVALQRYMLLVLFETYLAERTQREGSLRQTSSQTQKGTLLPEELGGGFDSTTDLEGLNPLLRPYKFSRSISRDMASLSMNQTTTFTPEYRPTFQEWVEARREIVALLRVVKSDPEHALESPDTPDLVVQGAVPTESHRVVQSRRGIMLNTDTILKLDDFEHNAGVSGGAGVGGDATVDLSKGGRNFRRVPGMRVYGVSTPAVFNAKALIRLIQTTQGAEKLLFCNLREEPFVYINEKPFVLRSVHRPFRNINAFADIDARRLEKAEQRMKKEILEEAARYGGKILVHVESADGTLKVLWEEIEDEDAVQTPKEVFTSLSSNEILPVSYTRIPMTPESEPGLIDIDDVLQTVRKSKADPGTHFVFFCQRGRGRSTIATVLACLELDEFFATDESESLSLLRGGVVSSRTASTNESVPMIDRDTMMSPAPELAVKDRMPHSTVTGDHMSGDEVASFHTDFPPLLSLVRVLKHGTMAKRWLDFTIDRCGAVFNIRKSILSQSIEAFAARSEEQSTAIVESALFELRRYYILLEVAGYCMEMKSLGPHMAHPSFQAWCSARPELQTLKEEIHDKTALVVMSHEHDTIEVPVTVLPDAPSDESTAEVAPGDRVSDKVLVANRKGRVLVRGSILKTDHFPGCKRLPDPLVDIEGAPNFRSVWPEGPLEGIDLRIYGTGIPTAAGLSSVLQFLKASANGQKEAIVWVNLREEPILYVNGRPFVLRRLHEPFANLEHTGISRSRVEEMEIRFKEDVLEEAASSSDYAVLIHEEDEDGGLRPKWEKVESVFTSKEMFDRYRQEFDLQYHRIPITDEQSPKPSAFDSIVDIVAMSKSTSHLVFNCQMGRGRTTSGLVVAAGTRLRMTGSLRRFANVVDNKIAQERKFRSKIRAKGAAELQPLIAKELHGDYLAITAQVRLMDDGLEAKRAMDALIDVCDSMQNLREAIHEVKVRSAKVDLTPALRAEAIGVAEHYLRRYAHLIQFAAYLLSAPDLGPKRVRFAHWLKSRPELGNALKMLIGEGKKSILSS